jgi:hypothetical protein
MGLRGGLAGRHHGQMARDRDSASSPDKDPPRGSRDVAAPSPTDPPGLHPRPDGVDDSRDAGVAAAPPGYAHPALFYPGLPAESGTSPGPVPGVDPGALVLAAAAAAISFLTGEGDWGPNAVVVGVTLTAIVLGYHRAVDPSPTWRHWALRLAFGTVLAFALGFALAWPLQELVMSNLYSHEQNENRESKAGDMTTRWIIGGWAVLSLVLAWKEAALAAALDRRRGQQSPNQSAERSH